MDIERMHMDPEFWYQHHTLNSNAQHLNSHMIDIVQQYMRGDASQMETYIELGELVCQHQHCKGFFMPSKLTLEAIRSTHADFYEFA
jgi:hypothetical protein